jgi:hypothetical protein
MRKLTLCCFATTALLALPLSVQASPAGVMAHAVGMHSAPGAGHVILVADDQKPDEQNQSAGDNKPTSDQKTTTSTKKSTTKKKSAHKKSTPSKKQVMKQIKQYVPKEYQGYLQQGAGGAGGAGAAGAGGGAGGGYGGYGGYQH